MLKLEDTYGSDARIALVRPFDDGLIFRLYAETVFNMNTYCRQSLIVPT